MKKKLGRKTFYKLGNFDTLCLKIIWAIISCRWNQYLQNFWSYTFWQNIAPIKNWMKEIQLAEKLFWKMTKNDNMFSETIVRIIISRKKHHQNKQNAPASPYKSI